MEPKTKLLDRMRNVRRLKSMSLHTEDAYVSWGKRFFLFHEKRHRADMGADEIHAFLTHLAVHDEVPDPAVCQLNPCSAIAFQRLIRRLCRSCHCFNSVA